MAHIAGKDDPSMNSVWRLARLAGHILLANTPLLILIAALLPLFLLTA